MTEKRFTQTEIKKQIDIVYSKYLRHYSTGKMDFKELVLIEHFILTLELDLGLDMNVEEKELKE